LDTKGSIKTGAKSATPISFEGKRYLTLALCVSVVVNETTVRKGRVDTFFDTAVFLQNNLVLKMLCFSIKTQLYCVKNALHVSATVSNHHQTKPKYIKERNNTVLMLVGDFGTYKCVL
jgi:hypothetical protein